MNIFLKNVEKFDSNSRINEVELTEELMVSKARSRNRAVYPCPSVQVGISVPIFHRDFFGKQKGTKEIS